MRRIAPLLLFASLLWPAGASATELTNEAPLSDQPVWSGSAWQPRPIAATRPPAHPYMAADSSSNLHGDAWMSDAYWRSGPLGIDLVQHSQNFDSLLPGLCASIAFAKDGNLISVCPSILGGPRLRLIDGNSLALLAELQLPAREGAAPANIFQDFTGGGYFYLDEQDRAVVGSNDRHIHVYARAGSSFISAADYDLTGVLRSGERLSSALPDWQGNIWFVSKTRGVVGFVRRTDGTVHSSVLGEEIENSFMIDASGVYVVSNKALYRFRVGQSGGVQRIWRSRPYPNTGKRKPGQVDAGSGTTPTMLPGGLVAITDNADPMNVAVYRAADGKQTCHASVFGKGGSATENSLIGVGRGDWNMLIVENNYGYDSPYSVDRGRTSKPGFARVDVTRQGTRCRKVWEQRVDSSPSVVPKLSVANGLIYTFLKVKTANGSDSWHWAALDARSGRRVWSRLAGSGGLRFNNNYSAIHIAPSGSLYLGVIGGLLKLEDHR